MKAKRGTLPTGTLPDGGLPPDCVRRLGKSLRKEWKRYVRKLTDCQKELSEEAIHDFRVEARRLLSTVELLGALIPARTGRKLHTAIKGHLDTFDELRDTQVQLPAVLRLEREFPAAQCFGDFLRQRLDRFTRSARKAIRKVRTRRVARHLEDSAAAVRAGRKKYAGLLGARLLLRSVSRAFDRVVRLQAHIDPDRPETIHRTRVAFKKFRYMAETLEGYLTARHEGVVEAMHRYQTAMGDIQDADVLCRGFARFPDAGSVAPASGREFANALSRRREELIRNFLGIAPELQEFWPPPGLRRRTPG